MTSVIDLGVFDPGSTNMFDIMWGWRKFIAEHTDNAAWKPHGFNPWEVRPPTYEVLDGIKQWHQDIGKMDCYMAVWASEHPTEVRDINTKQEVKLEPRHVYAFANLSYEHRTPADTGTDRFFARYYLHSTTKFKEVA